MDNGLCESTKLERIGSDCNGYLPQIVAYREADLMNDCALLAPPIIAFNTYVNNEDVHEWKEIHGIPFHQVELLCAQYKIENAICQLAIVDKLCVGYLLCHYFADSYLFIRQIFVYPEWEGEGIAEALVRSLGRPIKKVVFQTSTERTPKKLMSHVAKRAQLVSETKKFKTWEMEWN